MDRGDGKAPDSPLNIEYKALPSEVYKAIPTKWPPYTEIHADVPSWAAVNVGNIYETYATCVFLKANKGTRSALRSILWAAILAEPRAAAVLAKHCKSRGRVEDTPSNLLDAKETPYVNLGDDLFPPSDDEQDDPRQGKRKAKAMAAAAAGATSAVEEAAKTVPKKEPPWHRRLSRGPTPRDRLPHFPRGGTSGAPR